MGITSTYTDEYTYNTANAPSFDSSSGITQYYTTTGHVMSREDMPKKKKQSKNKKNPKFKSEIINWAIKQFKLDLSDVCAMFHSPMYTRRSSDLLNDFQLLPTLGYVAKSVPAHEYTKHGPFTERGNFVNLTKVFVDGVLEHLPGIMAQALFLKRLMARFHPERPGYLILSTKTREQICKEAERNNYPKDGKGYLVTLPGGQQARLEGIDDEEVRTIITYGRIGSIWKNDALSKIKGSHIIIWNGA